MFEIERVRDRERKIGYRLHKGTETLVRDRERFEIDGVRESQLYTVIFCNSAHSRYDPYPPPADNHSPKKLTKQDRPKAQSQTFTYAE